MGGGDSMQASSSDFSSMRDLPPVVSFFYPMMSAWVSPPLPPLLRLESCQPGSTDRERGQADMYYSVMITMIVENHFLGLWMTVQCGTTCFSINLIVVGPTSSFFSIVSLLSRVFSARACMQSNTGGRQICINFFFFLK